MSICPECREEYPERARIHRYAERIAKELAGLEKERQMILDRSPL